MANFSSENHLILILLGTLFTWQVTNSTVIKRSVLDNALDDPHEEDKRYSNFRGDLGKRDMEKRFSSFRSDLGKRSDFESEETFDDDDIKRIVLGLGDDMSKRSSFRADLGKRFSPYKSDLGKRVGILGGAEAPEDLLETIKRYGGMGFRADLGKRSSDEEEEDMEALRDFLLHGDENKRAYRSDLGKRFSGFRADLGKRSSFRSDLGKRSSFRSDLGKRQYFRADLGKRASYRADLGKRASFRADLGKRPSYRADLGKRSVDGTKRQQED